MFRHPDLATRRRVAGACYALLAVALAVAAVRCLFVNPDLVAWRAAALALGFGLGIWRFNYGVAVFMFLTPLLGMLPRSLGFSDLSLPEHLLIPLLVCGGLRMICEVPRTRTSRHANGIARPLAVYMAVVALSA